MGSLCCSGELLGITQDVLPKSDVQPLPDVQVERSVATSGSSRGSHALIVKEKHNPGSDPGQHDLVANDESETMQGLNAGVKMRVLADESPEAAEAFERQKHDEERRRKKEARKRARMTNLHHHGSVEDNFLSKIQEVEADVQYRYSFKVMGIHAKETLAAVVGSDAAQALEQGTAAVSASASATDLQMGHTGSSGKGGANSPRQDEAGSPFSPHSKQTVDRYRCLTSVSHGKGDKLKLAKLVFTPAGLPDSLPVCETRLDAANTTVMFVFTLDPAEKEFPLRKQVQAAVETVIDAGYIQPHLKPSFAALFLLVQESPANPGGADREQLDVLLQELEELVGDMLKFGPMILQDPNRLYSIFGQITTQRLIEADLMTNDNPIEGIEEADEDYSSRDGLAKSHGYSAEGRRSGWTK